MFCYVFFFKQKTAYEMRISDWSSDVCSSDLRRAAVARGALFIDERYRHQRAVARGHVNQFGFIIIMIVTRRYLLHLQRLELGAREVIIEHGVGGDHRFIVEPQLILMILGIVAEPRHISGLGELDSPGGQRSEERSVGKEGVRTW